MEKTIRNIKGRGGAIDMQTTKIYKCLHIMWALQGVDNVGGNIQGKKCLCTSDVRSFPSSGDRCLHEGWLTIPHTWLNHPHIIPPLNSSLWYNEWLLTNVDHYGNGGGRLDGHREGELKNRNTAHRSCDSLMKGKNYELLQMVIYVPIHDLY
jgi:hypothetical protein